MLPEEKRERLMEAASVVLENADGQRLNTVCLNKAIFYLDLVSLRDLGHTVTHTPFIALEKGPVVAKYDKRLIAELQKAGIAVQEADGQSKPVRLLAPIESYQFIPKKIMESIRKISKSFSGNASTKASDYSHENPGWALAFREGLGASQKPASINLIIAMQQIVSIDPWINEPLTTQDELALQAADDDTGEPW